MKTNRTLAVTKMLMVTMLVSHLLVGRAQAEPTVYTGKFTLAQQIQWGKGVLKPGTYTITIKSTANPVIALIRRVDGDGRMIRVVSGVREEETNGVNAMLLLEKDGQPTVHSLLLANLGMVLIYDPSLAKKAVQEASVSQQVPLMLAKK